MRKRRRAALLVGFLAYLITVKGVYLKTDAGKWVKVIEPDKQVDLDTEEAAVSFFNNQGRVPAGRYVNFKIDYYPPSSYDTRSITASRDFAEPVSVAAGAFVRAAFELDTKQIQLNGASLTVNQDERHLNKEELVWS